MINTQLIEFTRILSGAGPRQQEPVIDRLTRNPFIMLTDVPALPLSDQRNARFLVPDTFIFYIYNLFCTCSSSKT